MRIKNYGLEYYLKTPYAPKVEPNLFFAGKKVKTSYKEYEALIGNNNSIRLGKFTIIPLLALRRSAVLSRNIVIWQES